MCVSFLPTLKLQKAIIGTFYPCHSAFLVERSKTKGGLLACTAARLWLLHDVPSVVSQPDGVQSPAEAELIPAVYSKHADDAAGVGLADSLVASPNGQCLSGTTSHKTSATAPLRKEGAAPSVRGGKPSSVAKSSAGAFPEGSDMTLEGLSKLERLAVLGCGAFAYVLLVRRDQKYYALKVLSKAHILKKGLQVINDPGGGVVGWGRLCSQTFILVVDEQP